jgi:hypothetical protein
LRSISSSVSVQGRPAGRRPVISPSPSGPPILGRLGWVIAFNLRTAKGIGHYHPQPALFRVLSHNPSLSAYRFHKLATPIDLAPGQLSSLQAGAFDSSWPSRKYAPVVAPIKLGFLEPSAESNSERAHPVRAWLPLVPQRKRPLAISPAGPPGSKLIVYELRRPGLHRLAPANRRRESKMLFHQRNKKVVAVRTQDRPPFLCPRPTKPCGQSVIRS